jgi:cytochrome c oxidase cbb3-type subunit I/II
MIRTFTFESKRYGDPSTMGESVYDHPFQWGSKRTGPDLAREGGKYPSLWHYRHMTDPREVSPGSIMPAYAALATDKVDATVTGAKMRAMRSIGVPYGAAEIGSAADDEAAQAREIADDLRKDGADVDPHSEVVALIAYLQRLGVHPQPSPGGPAQVSLAK